MERKPLLKRRPSGKFKMHDFQKVDLLKLIEQDCSANWSEMGALKTTTAEWLWSNKLKHVPNPRVLVITTKSGKGTYFESLPEVLPEWDVFTVSPTKTFMVAGSRVVPVDVELPDPLYMRPVVVVAHYHCFTNKSCLPLIKEEVDPNNPDKKVPVLKEDGTFEVIVPRCTQLLANHWDMVIIDEAHRIKNPEAQWTRNIKKIKAQYKHAMTGTGFINNPAEIWSILNFLFPKTYKGYWKFREHYCEEDDYSGYRKIVGIKPENEQEFKELVRRVGVRRTMLECFPDIKEPIETVIKVELNAVQRKMYDSIKEELSLMDLNGTPLHSPNVLSMLNRLRQICVATPEVISERYDPVAERTIVEVKLREPSSKLDAVMETIEGLEWDAEEKQQVVIFSNFNDPLELLEARMKRKGIPYLRLLSKMNDAQRYNLWHEEWPKKEHQVFLTTLMLGSESINLTSATRAIFLDQSWSPKDNAQAIGRVYRPGQKGAVQLIYIRAEGTVDYKILGANQEKTGWFNQIFSDNEEEETGEDETTTD